MRKIFIDLGAYDGDTIGFFKEGKIWERDDLDQFEIFAFEPLPRLRETMEAIPDITFIPKAAWIEDGKTEITLDDFQSGTIVKENHLFPLYEGENRLTEIETMDFSKWLKDNFNEDDFILIKIDIEGAEFKLLNKMIQDGTDQMVDGFAIEFHTGSLHLPEMGEEHARLSEHLREKYINWW